jgi:lipopolysaccharide/colanic/teichoic acid biosynthesis glycosyltransferase
MSCAPKTLLLELFTGSRTSCTRQIEVEFRDVHMSNDVGTFSHSSPSQISTLETLVSPTRSGYLGIRSCLDKMIASLLLLLTSPIMLAAMLAVRLTSPGPVLYTQVRVGRNGVLFRIYKIRSMFHDCEIHSGPQWSRPGDHRVTLVGRFLRFTHIDELPQLVNVLRSEMSLVGPRPERPEFVDQLEKALPRYRERLMVLPGITGLAQIQLIPDTDLGSVASKLVCDIHYVQNVSCWLDLQILVSTPFHLLGIPFPVLHWLIRVPALRNLGRICAVQPHEFLCPVIPTDSGRIETVGQ